MSEAQNPLWAVVGNRGFEPSDRPVPWLFNHMSDAQGKADHLNRFDNTNQYYAAPVFVVRKEWVKAVQDRADLARAQVAAAYVAAANKVSIHMLGRNKAFADRVVAHVRALTPDDAKAALGDMLKAERDRIAGLVMVLRAHDQETDFEKGFDDACVAVLREIRALAQEDGE